MPCNARSIVTLGTDLHLVIDAAVSDDTAELEAILRTNVAFTIADDTARAQALAPVLYAACEYGQIEAVKLLLAAGARPTLSRGGRWSPLCIALACGHDEVAEYLLAHGAPVSPHAAAALGDLPRLQRLAREKPDLIASKGPSGAQPLHFAASVPVARWLVAQGADTSARDRVHRNTPARWAAADRRRQTVARYLVRYDPATELCLASATGDVERLRAVGGSQPELLNTKGARADLPSSGTPLHLALERGQRESAAALLELGANPNLRSGYGHFPLHIAAMRGDREAISLLLAHGARRSVRCTGGGTTPREWAERFGQASAAERL